MVGLGLDGADVVFEEEEIPGILLEVEESDVQYIRFYSNIWNFKSLLAIIKIIMKKLVDMQKPSFQQKSPAEQAVVRKTFSGFELPINCITKILNADKIEFSISISGIINIRKLYPYTTDDFMRRRQQVLDTVECDADEYWHSIPEFGPEDNLTKIARLYAEPRHNEYSVHFTAFTLCLNIYDIEEENVEKCAIAYDFSNYIELDDGTELYKDIAIMEYVLVYPMKYVKIAVFNRDNEEAIGEYNDILINDFSPTMARIVQKFCGRYYGITADVLRDIEHRFIDAFMESATDYRIVNRETGVPGMLWKSSIDTFQKLGIIMTMIIHDIFHIDRVYRPRIASDIDGESWNRMSYYDRLRCVLSKFANDSVEITEEQFSFDITTNLERRRVMIDMIPENELMEEVDYDIVQEPVVQDNTVVGENTSDSVVSDSNDYE